MRALGTFVKRNWKPLLSMVAAIAAAGWGAVQDVKGEISENSNRITAVEGELAPLKKDVGEIRCMIIAQHSDREPLDCLDR